MDAELFEKMIAFEEGRLGEGETIALFQQLVNSGDAWKLQGFYGRFAADLIEADLITLPPIPANNN